MRLKILITIFLFSSLSFSQSISKDDLIGAWVIESASVSPKMFLSEETKLMAKIESIFKDSEIYFSKDDLIKMELNGQLPEPFNQRMFDKVFYYKLKNDVIQVGHSKNSSSIMTIEVHKNANELNLNFLGVNVIVKKVERQFKLKFDKETSKSIASIAPSKPLMFVNIDHIEVAEFNGVEQIPISYDCDASLDPEKLRECVSNSIVNHINRRFNTDLASTLGLTGIVRIESEFIIDKDGDIANIVSSSPNAKLSNEAIRIINMLPRFKPATQDNVPISVKYKLPIVFQIVD